MKIIIFCLGLLSLFPCWFALHYYFLAHALFPRSNSDANLTISHTGAVNVQRILNSIYEWFPNANDFFITGGSAGGFASIIYAPEVARHYTNATIHTFADSALSFSPGTKLFQRLVEQVPWGLPNNLINVTMENLTHFDAYLLHQLNNELNDRYFLALFEHTDDPAEKHFHGYYSNQLSPPLH